MDYARRSLFTQLAASTASNTQQYEIRINGNENPVGPGAHALQSILAEMGEANRYPFNSRLGNLDILEALAARYEVSQENVVVGSGYWSTLYFRSLCLCRCVTINFEESLG